jgi:hypothetical protein
MNQTPPAAPENTTFGHLFFSQTPHLSQLLLALCNTLAWAQAFAVARAFF